MTTKTSKADAPKTFSEILKPMQAAASINPLFKPQIEQFWDAQEKFLDETERFTHHWFERRHEAIRTALNAARTTSGSGQADPAKAMEAMLDWQRHSMERLIEDAREWFDTVSRCANYAAETEAEAVEETLGEATKMAKESTKSAKSEPV